MVFPNFLSQGRAEQICICNFLSSDPIPADRVAACDFTVNLSGGKEDLLLIAKLSFVEIFAALPASQKDLHALLHSPGVTLVLSARSALGGSWRVPRRVPKDSRAPGGG